MQIIDARFRQHTWRYVGQVGLATLCVLIVLLLLDVVTHSISVASLGASSFIAFTMPHRRASRARPMVGGYLIGTAVGVFFSWVGLGTHAISGQAFAIRPVICSALAVGLSIFLMVITDCEHPPAAGLALGFVVSGVDLSGVAVALLGIISLYTAKTILKPVLIDLV